MRNIYFIIQYYVWQKKDNAYWNEECPFPREVEFMIADSIESLRPKMNLFASLEEAKQATFDLNKEYEDKISKLFSLSFSFG